MASVTNQFYYAHGGRPILKTEYDDGSEEFYDASGQFGGYDFSDLQDGEVFDPFGHMGSKMAQKEADWQQGRAVKEDNRKKKKQGGYADPGGTNMPARTQTNAQQQPQQQAPAPGQPVTPPNPTTGSQVRAGLDQNQQIEFDRYNYDPDQARNSMMNAMMDLGYQTVNNPYVTRLLQSAPALAMSFLGNRATQGNVGTGAVGQSFGQFGEFLRNALQQGKVFDSGAALSNNMPGMINAVRGFNAGIADGQSHSSAMEANPFLASLAAIMAGNQGRDALSMYTSGVMPLMTNRMQGAYQNLMQDTGLRGTRAFQEAVQRGDASMSRPGAGGNDWWKYIFGY